MRLNNFHLTYCTNIHPGANWTSTFQSLKDYVPGIKEEISSKKPFGLGLRLSNKASEELNTESNLQELKQWLQDQEVYVFTMNGFPYGNFHDERVKDQVHAPDWTTSDRLKYTKRLFDQLAYLLPEGVEGGISTSPISYKYWHPTKRSKEEAFEKGAKNLAEVVWHLYQLEETTAKYMHLDIEPEPDGLIENSDEVLMFFERYLVPLASDILADRLATKKIDLENLIKRYITVCYDICHFSLAYEEPSYTLPKFENAGIKVGKIQVSAALKIVYTEDNEHQIWESLARFNEPTYLHQVTEKKGDVVVTYNDLPIVLEQKQPFKELRAHFHVPIFLEQFGQLYATQDHILKVIDYIKKYQVSEHLEVETYTWDVLPEELKKDLSTSIIRELKWLIDRL